MNKDYKVDFLDISKESENPLSPPKYIDGLDISKYLEALILERSAEGYELVNTQLHYEIHSTFGLIPTGYLVTFKLIFF